MRGPPVPKPVSYPAGWWLSGYLLVFALGVVVGTYASPIWPERSQANAAVEAREAGTGNTSPSRRPVAEISGSGDHIEGPFYLAEGPAFVAIQFEGHRTCRVRLLNERGEPTSPAESPAGFVGGQFGPWKARTVAQIAANGRYFLEVSGEGDWKVVVTQ